MAPASRPTLRLRPGRATRSRSSCGPSASRSARRRQGTNRLKGRIAATSYLGGSAIYAIDAQGLKLQANTIIEDRVFREGDEVDIGFAPSDCVLLGADDRRLA